MKTRSTLIILAVVFALGIATGAAPCYATVLKPSVKFIKLPPRVMMQHR